MLFRNLLLPGIVIPSACAAAVFLLTIWIGKRSNREIGAGLALAAAFLSAFVAMTGWPRWPPVGSSQKLFYFVALAALLGLATAWLQQRWAAWLLRGALLAFLLVQLLSTPIENTWSRGQAALWLAGLLAAALAVAWAWSVPLRAAGGAGDGDPWWAAAVRLALLGGTALVLGLSESARLAQLAGAVACGVFAVEVIARLLRRRPWRAGDAIVLSTAVLGLMVIGHFYAGLEPLPAILLLLAFLLLALPARSQWIRLAPLLPLAIALGLVIAAAMSKPEDPYDDYSGLPTGAPEQARTLIRQPISSRAPEEQAANSGAYIDWRVAGPPPSRTIASSFVAEDLGKAIGRQNTVPPSQQRLGIGRRDTLVDGGVERAELEL